MLIHQVAHCFTDTTKTLISEYNSERIIEIGLPLQSYHKNKKCLVFYRPQCRFYTVDCGL